MEDQKNLKGGSLRLRPILKDDLPAQTMVYYNWKKDTLICMVSLYRVRVYKPSVFPLYSRTRSSITT
jgi:hypothetical protein